MLKGSLAVTQYSLKASMTKASTASGGRLLLDKIPSDLCDILRSQNTFPSFSPLPPRNKIWKEGLTYTYLCHHRDDTHQLVCCLSK